VFWKGLQHLAMQPCHVCRLQTTTTFLEALLLPEIDMLRGIDAALADTRVVTVVRHPTQLISCKERIEIRGERQAVGGSAGYSTQAIFA
jgi:hypothetical protein